MYSNRLWCFFVISISLFAIHVTANQNLELKFQWKTIDFQFESLEKREAAIQSKTFIPENVIPVGLDIYKDRLFLSLPRLKEGVPATLAYINLTEADQKLKPNHLPANLPANDVANAPLLKPFPNWAAHQTVSQGDPEILSPFHIRIDKCGRLWTVDTGISGSLELLQEKQPAISRDPQILIYDLTTDNKIHSYKLPSAMNSSIYSNIVIDDTDADCGNAYAYIAVTGANRPHLIVYSLKQNVSWTVEHNFFHFDPLAGNFSVLGVNYQTSDALYALTLTEKKSNGFPDLYFHALTSYREFKVSTEVLRNQALFGSGQAAYYKKFIDVGVRDTNQQSGISAYDTDKQTMFYTLPNKNEVACWKVSDKNTYAVHEIFDSPGYPFDIKVDDSDSIWILSNNMHRFIKTDMKSPSYSVNFYIHYGSVNKLIKNTMCDQNLLDYFNNLLFKRNDSTTFRPITFLIFITPILLTLKHLF